MAQSNKPQKRKISSKKEGPKFKKPTPNEIAFINRTDPPPDEPESEMKVHLEKYCVVLFEMFLTKLVDFMDTYAGFYSKAQMQKMCDLTKNTLNAWINDKGLPIYQVEKKIMIKKSDMENFMKKYRKIMPLLILSLSEISDTGALLLAA